ncbi:precorrin-6y C5,15-methyltransferase (decarboxylating) subunit CbiE [Myxosarcina sp. GI1(2024)]
MAQLQVVGIGLDGLAGLTKKTENIIDDATILIGSRRHLNYFKDFPIRQLVLDNLQSDIEFIRQLIETQDRPVILVSGDPLFFGLGRLLLEKLPAEKISFHPHLSSIQLAFNRLKIPWQDAAFISVHGRDPDESIELLKRGKEKIAILTDSEHNPAAIARLYLSLDLPTNYTFHVCEKLAALEEKITTFTSEKIFELANLSATNFAPLNVLILIEESPNYNSELEKLPILGLPDRLFFSFRDRPGLITKREVRLAVLGELALQSKQIVWDIGAGTGSVSIEIARLCPSARIFAVEQTSMGINLISKNCQRFKVNNVKIISGKAPEALFKLPNPDRIFIGGSGGNLVDILEFCRQRINNNGVLVIALATVEHGYQVVDWLRQNSWHYRLLQLQISRSTPIKNLTRFTPLNPVTIITANLNSN